MKLRGLGFQIYLEAHGTSVTTYNWLITLLIMPLNGLIGVTPILSRVIIPVISSC